MTRYLLGQATTAEQTALEDRYATEPEFFEALVTLEHELADRYARRELSAAEQAAYERHVLAHPRRRARSEFAQVFALQPEQWANVDARVLAPSRGGRFAKWWRVMQGNWKGSFGLVTAVLLLMAGSWWLWQASRHRVPIAVVPQTNATASPALNATPAASASPQVKSAGSAKAVLAFVTLTLDAGLVRSNENAEVPTVTILPETDEVRLRLKADLSGYARYRLTLQRAEGKALRHLVTSPQSGPLTFTVPAKLLSDGEYFIAVSGLNPNGEADALSKVVFQVSHRK